jgi:hypothetical protein
MHKGMLPVPGVVRRLLPAFAVAAVVAGPLVPGAAQAQEPVGSTVVGELVQAVPETAEGEAAHAAEQPITWVETAGGESVRIPTEEAAGLTAGSTVEVTVGAEVDDAAGQGLEPARELLDSTVVAEQRSATVTTNEVTVALVAPRGVARDATTPAQLAAAVDGPVADFWAAQTGDAVNLHVGTTHAGWVDTTVGCGDPARMWDQAASAVGFEAGPGKHLVLYLSSAAPENCAYGLAEIGSDVSSGGRVYVRDVLPSLIAHELGHNFGLGHSSALYCADGAETGGCETAPYRDLYDVMGASWDQVGTLNAVQAARLGLLDGPGRRTVPADGTSSTVQLAPLAGADGVRGVRLVGHGGLEYWLELRTPSGQDRWLGTGDDDYGLEGGVLVHRTGEWPDTSLLLDPTPSSGREGDYQAAVPVGGSVTLTGGFAVTVTAANLSGATVEITSTATASDALPEPAPAADAPDVLPAESAAQGAVPSDAGAAAPAQPAAETAAVEPAAADTDTVADAVEAAPEQPAVVTAAHARSLGLPVAAAGVLAGAAALVGVRLVRTRARR